MQRPPSLTAQQGNPLCLPTNGLVYGRLMMENTKKGDPGHPRPKFELRVCILCGCPAQFKWDRRKRAYIGCGICSTRVFLHSELAYAGVEVVQQMILRQNPKRFRATVQQRAMRESIVQLGR